MDGHAKAICRPNVHNTSRLRGRHPVETQEYALYTPPIDEMIGTLGDWIDARVSGGYVYGPSRYGKSRAVKWFIKRRLEERFSRKLPLVVWVRRPSLMNEGEFWNELLDASQFKFYDPLKPKTKTSARFLFMQQLITLARVARTNFIVLVIDEAHEVSIREWTWLIGLQNALDLEGYRFSVFSIGTHQVAYVPDFLAKTGNAHIVARFFARSARYHGLGSVDHLRYVLNGYDEDSEWPTGSGVSYLEFFAPEAFEEGCRLAACAPVIWKAFVALLPDLPKRKKGEGQIELPMEHVARTSEALLKRLAAGARWAEVIAETSLLQEVAKTGFTDHIKRIHMRVA